MSTKRSSRPSRRARAARLGVAALSTAAALVGVEAADQRPADASCFGLYDYYYGSDCGTDPYNNPFYDPCDIFSPYFDPFACFNPGYTDPPTGGGGGGGGGGGTPAPPVLAPNQHVPANGRESTINGTAYRLPTVTGLVRNTNPDIIFKNEENTDPYPGNENTDSLMTPLLKTRLDRLAQLVKAEFPGFKLRVSDAFDIDNEHSPADDDMTSEDVSLHYEGRAADLSVGTSPSEFDNSKLGRLGQLAVDAGFEWVNYETRGVPPHIHVSVPRGPDNPAPTPTPSPPPNPRPPCTRPPCPAQQIDE